ncbi:hypothetical protein, partial [Klebsiella pneumoniae]|uniref:hypothetical protein n=1 Tax=Klebsiella pneumoniae TaxID=573 RepID=UPI00300BBA90
AAHCAAPAATTADIATGHTTTATATRGCVGCHGDVIQRQVAEVTDPGPEQIGRGRRATASAAVAGLQALGNHQPVQGRGNPG